MADQEASPLAGLTEAQADEAIEKLQAKVDAGDASLKASKDHLKAMKAARKHLTPPSAGGPGVEAHAEPAQMIVEGGEIG